MWFISYCSYLLVFVSLDVRSVLRWKASDVSSRKGRVCLGEGVGLKVSGFMAGGF